jgi:hypothetical protein
VQALDLITGSLRDIGVIGESETPTAEQGQTGVTKLNELMASLAEDGIDLGWAPVSLTTDTVVLPAGHISALKAMLSVSQASVYGADPSPMVAGRANNGYIRLLGQAFSLAVERAQSNTLPAGNSQRSGERILTG